MRENEKIAAVEQVVTGLHTTLPAEYRTPLGGVEMACEWTGEDFSRIVLASSAEEVFVVVTSVVGEEGADVRVVVSAPEGREGGPLGCGARARDLGRVARAVAAIPCVDSVWPDAEWPKTFLVAVRREGGDS